MMKRVLIPFTFALLAGPAAASPELAELWGAKAATLSAQSADLLDAARHGRMPALDEDYVIELERFALNATRLGMWSDASGGPAALGCTFRSLGAEAESELDALEAADTARSTETALSQLMTLFDSAQDLSTAAAWAARHHSTQPETASAANSPDACPGTPGRIAAR